MSRCNPRTHVMASKDGCKRQPIRHGIAQRTRDNRVKGQSLAGTATGYKAGCRCCDCCLWKKGENSQRKPQRHLRYKAMARERMAMLATNELAEPMPVVHKTVAQAVEAVPVKPQTIQPVTVRPQIITAEYTPAVTPVYQCGQCSEAYPYQEIPLLCPNGHNGMQKVDSRVTAVKPCPECGLRFFDGSAGQYLASLHRCE